MHISLQAIKHCVDFNVSRIHSVRCVAERVRAPYDTVRKSFLRTERLPLGDYIIARKVQAMKELLLISELSCSEVCYTFGFRNDTGAKIFKKSTGVTMKQYRRKNRLQ